jgi:cytochrome c oxidase subunit IV
MSDHSHSSSEVAFAPQHAQNTKMIWKVFWILSAITIVELFLGYMLFKHPEGGDWGNGLRLFVKGVIIILSLAKAFYIVGYFMHLRDEIKNMIMTIVVPLLLFVWFILAFLMDGESWRNLRNTKAGSEPAKVEQTEAAKPGVKQ